MRHRDWRLPENRREAFQRFYSFHLEYQSHPGCVYALLPAIAKAYDLDEDQRAWLVWLNGNTQNVVSSLLLLEAAPSPRDWVKAVDFWNENFKKLEWDTDRRHHKGKFGVATEEWFLNYGHKPAFDWQAKGVMGWDDTWEYANSQPYMGRLSSWSMIEYARILLGPVVPDAGTWMLGDLNGSRSHRNGLALVAGYNSVFWEADAAKMLGITDELNRFADHLLEEAGNRNAGNPWYHDVGRLTMESALCTYKSWHKPNRRYPNVYSDMMYNRIKKAETRFGRTFDLLWDARKEHLPPGLRLERMPSDPGMVPVKQNHYLETGEVIMMEDQYSDMQSSFHENVISGAYGTRKDPSWKL